MKYHSFLNYLQEEKQLPLEEFQQIQTYLQEFQRHLLLAEPTPLTLPEKKPDSNLETFITLKDLLPDQKTPEDEDFQTTKPFVTPSAPENAGLEEIQALCSSDFIPHTKDPLVEQRYEWKRDLGEGGMGLVQVFHDRILNREVALKTIKKLNGTRTEKFAILYKQRFLKEAEFMALLEHPNIVPLYDMKRKEDGQLFLIMRKIEGQTLSSYLQKDLPSSPHWNEIQILSIFRKICDAIAYAHSRGVVHRDLKPDNIMLGAFGEVYVMDWGIAKKINPATSNFSEATVLTPSEINLPYAALKKNKETTLQDYSQLEETNAQNDQESDLALDPLKTIGGIGTPGYMSPEQRFCASKVTEKADIFSLGKILRQCYTGLTPLQEMRLLIDKLKNSDQQETLQKLVEREMQIPKEILAIIQKATENETAKRYDSVQHFCEDLERYLRHQRVSAILKNEELSQETLQEKPIEVYLRQICFEESLVQKLLLYLEKQSFDSQSYVIKQGSPANELYLVASGLTIAQLEVSDGKNVRLRSMGPGSIIGEIGLYLKGIRTVSVLTLKPSTIYCLTHHAFEEMKRKDPQVAIALQDYLICTLGQRLNGNSKVIESLLEKNSS
jgi:serine/threonine protein kinase